MQGPRPVSTAEARQTATFYPVDRYQTQVLVPPNVSEMCVIKTLSSTTTWRGAHRLQSFSFCKLRMRRGTIAWLLIFLQRRRVPGYPHAEPLAAAAQERPKASRAAALPAAVVAAEPVAAVLAPTGVAVVAAAVVVLPNRTVILGSAGVRSRPKRPVTGLLCAV